MNIYVKRFLQRGMAFGGFGPIIAGIIYAVIDANIDNLVLTGVEVCIAIISTYALAFIQAGASVFNQIEHWSVPKSTLFHFGAIYIAYVGCYLINTWIPFEPIVIAIFTGIFAVSYLIIWSIVVITIKLTSKKLNKKLL